MGKDYNESWVKDADKMDLIVEIEAMVYEATELFEHLERLKFFFQKINPNFS